MNPLRPPSSNSRQGRFVVAATTTPTDGSSSRVGGATSPTLQSLRDAGFPEWWKNSSPLGSSEGICPQGGFTNLLESNNIPENFYFIGNTNTSSTMMPNAPSLKRSLPVKRNAKVRETIVVDSDELNEDERTERRLNYTKDEDVRWASAWLRHSKDPVDGTDRNGDQYWTAVTKEYNTGTEVSRRRNRNQLKIRWDRIKKTVTEFHGCWVSATKVYRSGFSDDQLMGMAEKMYAEAHNKKDFQLKHIWNVVKDERKWSAYCKKELEKEMNKGASQSQAHVVNLEDNPNVRPMGHKKAKDELYGKKKIPQGYSAVSEKVNKFIEVSTEVRKDREKMVETQQLMAKSKVEAARFNDKAAEKQLKCKMLDTYRELLLAPTINMNDQAMAERDKALERLRLTLFQSDN